jgi:hypothetical protein
MLRKAALFAGGLFVRIIVGVVGTYLGTSRKTNREGSTLRRSFGNFRALVLGLARIVGCLSIHLAIHDVPPASKIVFQRTVTPRRATRRWLTG